MANFKAFRWNISSSINLLFLKSDQSLLLISFQGTIVDRIDYNIENTSIQVEEGVEQLKKAARYQKKDRKMYCIVILAVIDVILFCIWYNN